MGVANTLQWKRFPVPGVQATLPACAVDSESALQWLDRTGEEGAPTAMTQERAITFDRSVAAPNPHLWGPTLRGRFPHLLVDQEGRLERGAAVRPRPRGM